MSKIRRVVIAGGGTAGWMAAAGISKLLGSTVEVTLVESDDIPTIGVGEATIPTLHVFHRLMGIDEQEFMRFTNATFKLGIRFENWKALNSSYLHAFGMIGRDTWAGGFHHFWLKGKKLGLVSDIGDYIPEHLAARQGKCALGTNQERSYAYHLDAGLYATFLKDIALSNNAVRVEGKISEVKICNNSGYITSLLLSSGQEIHGDIFIDCTGFRSLLIEKALHTQHQDFNHWLLCDKAIAVQTESTQTPIPYTRSIAHNAGWQWRIPLQNRTGNGLVYSSSYLSDEQAVALLLSNVEGNTLNEPRAINIRVGFREHQWSKNCIAIGLASGFIEPLESTGIHLFQQAIIRLLKLFPQDTIHQSDIDEFNSQSKQEIEHIRDFIILHYHLTERCDSPFWRYCKNMDIPDSLKHKMDMFSQSGRIPKTPGELFHEDSWVQVMLGQGLHPKSYHRVVDRLTDEDLKHFLNDVKNTVHKRVQSWPAHADYLKHYCSYTGK